MIAAKPSTQPWSPLTTAWVFGLLHAVMDAASLAVLYAEVSLGRLPFEQIALLIIGYNVLAFGLQAPLGWVSDRLGAYRAFAAVGLALAVPAIAVGARWPYAAAVTIGVGNALFHVGAGALVLRRSNFRATAPGIFVAPGAGGLALGIWLGWSGFPCRGLLAAMAAAGALLAVIARASPPRAAGVDAPRARAPLGAAALCVALLCASVALRSLGGGAVSIWWGGLLLTGAVVGGKAAGGFLADRLGWRFVGVGSLLLVAPLAGLIPAHAPSAVLAALLIQLTMAVTLTATYAAMPERPGLAFGLPCLALLLGAAPGLARSAGYLSYDPAPWLLPLALVSAAAIYVGLSLLPARPRAGRPERRPGPEAASSNAVPRKPAAARRAPVASSPATEYTLAGDE